MNNTRIAVIGGRSFVVGLDWDQRPIAPLFTFTSPAAGKVKGSQRLSHKGAGIQLKNRKSVATGLISGPLAKKKKEFAGITAAAALATVACKTGNAVLVERVDNESGLYWLCVIQNGLPNAMADQLGSLDAIEQSVMLAMQGMPNAVRLPAGTLAKLATDKRTGSLRQFTPRASVSKANLIPLVTLGVLLAVVGIYEGSEQYDQYEREQAIKRADAQKNRQQQQVISAETQRQLDAVRGHLLSLPPKAAFDTWFNLLSEERTVVAGWRLQRLLCINTSCELQYQRLQGDLTELRKVKNGATSDWSKLDSATAKVSVPPSGKSEDALLSLVPLTDELSVRLLSLAQIGLEDKTTFKLEPAAESRVGNTTYHTGNWKADGSRWGNLTRLLANLDGLPLNRSLVLDQLEVNLQNGHIDKWSLRGQYVFRMETVK